MINLPLQIDFTGKVVVITGAGGVICGAMARAFAQAGAKVAALDLNEDAVKKLAGQLKAEGFACEGYKANVLDPEALRAVHDRVLTDLGPCDILVNGAGGNNPKATTDNEYQHAAKEGQNSALRRWPSPCARPSPPATTTGRPCSTTGRAAASPNATTCTSWTGPAAATASVPA